MSAARVFLVAAWTALALVATAAFAQSTQRPPCDGACGVIQSIAPVTERQEWTPLGAVSPGGSGITSPGGMSGTSTQISFGPGFTNQGLVVLGAAGGAMYAQRPSDYRRQRWDVTLRMDNGQTRVVSLRTEPLLVQEGDYVRVSGNSLELLTP
jgi:outer membrane lipoprotein SlyB